MMTSAAMMTMMMVMTTSAMTMTTTSPMMMVRIVLLRLRSLNYFHSCSWSILRSTIRSMVTLMMISTPSGASPEMSRRVSAIVLCECLTVDRSCAVLLVHLRYR